MERKKSKITKLQNRKSTKCSDKNIRNLMDAKIERDLKNPSRLKVGI